MNFGGFNDLAIFVFCNFFLFWQVFNFCVRTENIIQGITNQIEQLQIVGLTLTRMT
jgi:hypothetical protein